jgi:CheY-like chemotaxis protein
VENGELAVNQYSKDAFDLILMDIQMPVMDGLEAARSIRTIERERGLPAIPIVALSATTREEDVQLSLDSGCNALISKPISKQRLLEAIERHGQR